MVLLFVVCGWREETVAGVCQRTYLVHSTYVFFVPEATKDGKIVNPAVVLGYESINVSMYRVPVPTYLFIGEFSL